MVATSNAKGDAANAIALSFEFGIGGWACLICSPGAESPWGRGHLTRDI